EGRERDRLVLPSATPARELDRASRPRHGLVVATPQQLDLRASGAQASADQPTLPRLAAKRVVPRAGQRPLDAAEVALQQLGADQIRSGVHPRHVEVRRTQAVDDLLAATARFLEREDVPE